jgi:DNA polymerase III subunit beta
VLSDYLAELPPEPVHLAYEPDGQRVHAHCGRFSARLATQPADDFPTVSAGGAGPALELPADELRAAIDRVAFAAAHEDARPVLAAVQLRADGDGVTLVGCDGFRLARACLPTAVGATASYLVPARVIAEYARLLAEAQTACISASADGHVLYCQAGDGAVVGRLLDGRYPDTERIVPAEWRTRLTVATAGLRRAAQTAHLFGAEERGRPVLLEATAGHLRVRAQGDERGDAVSELNAALEGEPQAITLDGRLFTSVLDAAAARTHELSWQHPRAPLLVREVGARRRGEQPDPADLWLLMPLNPAAQAEQPHERSA